MQNISQVQENLIDIGQQGSMLEAYFQHNKALKQIKNWEFLLLGNAWTINNFYSDFPTIVTSLPSEL